MRLKYLFTETLEKSFFFFAMENSKVLFFLLIVRYWSKLWVLSRKKKQWTTVKSNNVITTISELNWQFFLACFFLIIGIYSKAPNMVEIIYLEVNLKSLHPGAFKSKLCYWKLDVSWVKHCNRFNEYDGRLLTSVFNICGKLFTLFSAILNFVALCFQVTLCRLKLAQVNIREKLFGSCSHH